MSVLLLNLLPAVHKGGWTFESGSKVLGQSYGSETDFEGQLPHWTNDEPLNGGTLSEVTVTANGTAYLTGQTASVNVTSGINVDLSALSDLAASLSSSNAATASVAPLYSTSGGFSGFSWEIYNSSGGEVSSGVDIVSGGEATASEINLLNQITAATGGGSSGGGGSSSSITAYYQNIANNLVSSLENKMKSFYKDNSIKFPSVVYDPNYPGKGYSRNENGVITLSPKFFSVLTSDGDRMSCLRHEFKHYMDEKNGINPIAKSNGHIIRIETNLSKNYTKAEYDYQVQICKGYNVQPERLDYCAKEALSGTYVYICSNYEQEEIDALNAELQGEKDGLYVLSNSYRNERLNNIIERQFELGRSLDYENLYNRKNDGNSK